MDDCIFDVDFPHYVVTVVALIHNHHLQTMDWYSLIPCSIMGQFVVTLAELSSGEASPGAMSVSGGTTSVRWAYVIPSSSLSTLLLITGQQHHTDQLQAM